MKKLFILLLLFVGGQAETAAPNGNEKTAQNQGCLSNIPPLEEPFFGKVDIFADFLVWFASEEPSSAWGSIAGSTFNPLIVDTFEAKGISFGWDFGFRVGAGTKLKYDHWDTQLYWSWFRTIAHSSIPTTNSLILPEFFGGFVNGDHAKNGKLHWTLLFNMCDWELGRRYEIGKRLSLRPFLGLKGGWINQTIRSLWQVNAREVQGVTLPVDYSAKEDLKNNFWGIGPSVGVNSMWNLVHFESHALNLFGDFSTAMMRGTWMCKDRYSNPTPYEIFVNMKNTSLGALMMRGFLGFGWDAYWNREKYHFAAKLGYEMQLWLNQLRIPTFQQIRLHGDLSLQGGTFNCRFDF